MSIPKPLPYIAAFEEMGLGMFVHWGLYSQLGMGEWTYYIHKRDKAEYQRLTETFTACDFNAEEWVLTAKAAGCKYITLTTRHHDGFSLYDTCGLTDFDAVHSAAGRDLVREFVDACRKHDIMPVFYHTTLDWTHPDYTENFDAYLEYLRKSVETLCKNYGKIGGLWFDGNWSKPKEAWREDELYATIRKYQPEALIIDNTGLNRRGEIGHPELDSVTYEQGRPEPMDREGMPKYLAAEMCHTINDHWGIGHNDFNYQSPASIIEHLCACRRVGANYLLNIGPRAQGALEPIQRELLLILGRWMKIYGEAIYGGRPYPTTCEAFPKNFVLRGDGCLYFFVHDLGRHGNKNVTVGGRYVGDIAFAGVTDEIAAIEWMDSGEPLEFSQADGVFTANFTGYPYGTSTCVRVAKATIKK